MSPLFQFIKAFQIFVFFLCSMLMGWAQAGNEMKNLTILAYHEVTSEPQPLMPEYAIEPKQLQQHLDWLVQNGFQFIGSQQLLEAQQHNKALPEKSVLLSFDDGYQSFYQHVYPVLKQRNIPAVLSVVGRWLEPAEQQQVNFGGQLVSRQHFLSWAQLKELQASGLVEIASHSYDLHKGIVANPQGNQLPATVARAYFPQQQRYEDDNAYQKRIQQDLKANQRLLQKHGLKAPKIMVWPYGRYNLHTVKIAEKLKMPISLTLDDAENQPVNSFSRLPRILIQKHMDAALLAKEIQKHQQQRTDNDRPQKIMHVDIDYIYDPDPQQQERNLGLLLDRIQQIGVNTVYLQAFSDPDGNGSADLVYFPNRYIPMRADLFNRVAWQIQTRTQVRRVYAWMPVFAWELPVSNPVAQDLVQTEQPHSGKHLNMGYHRLSPFSPRARNTIKGIYEDLAKSAQFNGIIFHDDATLSDYEDASSWAKKAYQQQGLATDLVQLRADDTALQKWTAYKVKVIDDFAMELAETVRQYQPYLQTSRNLYAQVALSAYSENWYAQSLEQSLNRYDFTAIMAMPYMEQVDDPAQFYRQLLSRVQQYPQGLRKTVFELQAVDWRNGNKIPSVEIAETIQTLYQAGVKHIAYYPDDPIQNHPDPTVLRQAFQPQPISAP